MPSYSLKHYILLVKCSDNPGIIAAVTTHIFRLGADIKQSHQFCDSSNQQFFMRISFIVGSTITKTLIKRKLHGLVDKFDMTIELYDAQAKPNVIIMVSQQDHALTDLLYRIAIGDIQAHVVAIISNHEVAKPIAERASIPFYYWPTRMSKGHRLQEKALGQLMQETRCELVVLARYMQIFSENFCQYYYGKVINIHHSFLPSFKGAKPYEQAWKRGVKLIGATAHYITPDLDGGPIIEQETTRVSHEMTSQDFVTQGRYIECRVLAQAVKLHIERRIMLNDQRTVIFY